jgi:nitroimidazol reductase NimA-like FMN-containing flavoprotein (pyridoxamine 5'-phosphate oxidase superfamily)
MQILALTHRECLETLTRLQFGRLASSRDNQPYLVPIYSAYHHAHLYGFATLGQKIEWMRANPRVCIEADEITAPDHWVSVIVQGRYEELLDPPKGRGNVN